MRNHKQQNLSGFKIDFKSVAMNVASGVFAGNPLFSLVNIGVTRYLEKKDADKAKKDARKAAYREVDAARRAREALLKAIADSIKGSRVEAERIIDSTKARNAAEITDLQRKASMIMYASAGGVALYYLYKKVT